MSSASAASSSSKKVEWYHLDRVAIAKRICLDPTAVKLKTALNNNNNNDYGTGGGKSAKNSCSGGGNVSTGGSNSGGGGGSAIISAGAAAPVPVGSGKASKTAKSATAYEQIQHRSRIYPKAGFESGNGTRVGPIASAIDTSKGLFSTLRYTPSGTGVSGKSIPPSFLSSGASSAGSRQFAALQQKRRRKAARVLAAGGTTPPSQIAKEPSSGRDCKGLLGEECLLVKGGTSCGSSSRSSSSGVSSDFEELDATSSNSIMKGTSAGPRGGGDCQSSSDCEDEDEEGSILPHPFTPSTKLCNSNSVNTTVNVSNDGSNHNLSNLNILNSVSVLIDGVGASGVGKGGGVTLCKGGGGRVVLDPSRIVNGKIAFVTSCKANSLLNGMAASKLRTEVGVGSGKHASINGTSTSASSASSTTSGSIDNDRDTDNSFSEFPTDLDFMGVVDKGKRRTDRYDSSESSDSGVATLSPSTSDSPELISTCCDFTSEHLDVVGNLISASRSSSLSKSSTYPTISSSKSSSPSSTSSSASSTSSCSGNSAASLTAERQGEPATGSALTTTNIASTTTVGSNASIVEASLPPSTGSDTGSSLQTNPPVHREALCLWKGCTCSTTEASHNILEHIQTTHVAPQMKTAGYVCLWEGCKVFSKRSSSLSWLERHVLSHSGNKPFKCIFPGCGLSFSSQTTLERHVNSHIATNGTTNGTQGNSTLANRKLDASPGKSSRRKKIRFRKQRVNIGQRVDYFDKRIMEVIKHWLASSVDQFAVNAHDCTFRGEVMARRVIAHCERQLLVRWHPRFILPDEWLPESEFTRLKLVPLRRIPTDKIRLLYPSLFPPARQEKATRKRKPRSNLSPLSSSRSTPTHSEGSSSLTTLPPSPSELPTFIHDADTFMCTSRSTRSSSTTSSLASLSSFSSSSSAASSSFVVQQAASHKSSNNQKTPSTPTTSSTTSSIIGGVRSTRIKSELERREDKCHKKFCGSSSCDCPSALFAGEVDHAEEEDDDEDETTTLESSHWALEVLYEDFGMVSS